MKIVKLKLFDIVPFKNHPFKGLQNDLFDELKNT